VCTSTTILVGIKLIVSFQTYDMPANVAARRLTVSANALDGFEASVGEVSHLRWRCWVVEGIRRRTRLSSKVSTEVLPSSVMSIDFCKARNHVSMRRLNQNA
jgi:hypothetical protein